MIRRRVQTLIVAAATLGLVAPAAAGHPRLVSISPPPESAVASAPSTVRLQFTEPVRIAISKISVLDRDGRDLVAGRLRFDARHGVVAPLRAGARGVYTVHWQMVGDEGHVVSGVYAFGIQQQPGAPRASPGSGQSLRSDTIRWLYFVALALVGGGLLFLVVILDPVLRDRPEDDAWREWVWKRSLTIAGIAAIAALHLALYGYLDWAQQVVGGDWSAFSRAQIHNLRTQAPIGIAWTWTTGCWLGVLGLLFAAGLRPRARVPLASTAAGLALVAGLGLTLSGHAAAAPGWVGVVVVADYVHLVAAALWLGGVAWLALIVWPATRDPRRVARRQLLRSCLERFSTMAAYIVATLVLAGGFLVVTKLHSPRDLLSDYGVTLVLKSLIAVAALAMGVAHRQVLPRILAHGHPARRSGTRSLRLEAFLLIAVMFAAAILTNTAPPA